VVAPSKSKNAELLVGLDIGTSKVAAVVGEANDGVLSIVGCGAAPSEGLRKGVVVNIDATVQAIEEALKEAEVAAGCEIHTVVTDVGGSHIRGFNSHGVVAVHSGEVNRADVDRVLDAARAVALPADRDLIHLLPQEFVLDGQDGIAVPVGMSGVRLETRVHIITAAASSAQNVLKCCEKAGVHVADLVVEPLAAAEAVLTAEEKELGVALIDIGAGTTDVLVFHQGSLKHTAVLPLGGNHISSDIAAGLRTPFREAELLKRRHGCALARLLTKEQSVEVPSVGGRGPRLIGQQTLSKVIEARVEEMLELARHQIIKCGFDESLGSGVVLTGGTASMSGMEPLAEAVFRTPVRCGNPGDCNGNSAALLGNAPSFAAAIGLAQCAARPPEHSLLLRHGQRRIMGRFGQRVRGWIENVLS
jgi:cell division protein FtsA